MSISRLRALLTPSDVGQGAPRQMRATVLQAAPYMLVLLVLTLLVLFGPKFWETNDDEHIAMIAHGYGISSTPSAGLVFSNVAWGWLISRLGSVGHIQGYTLGQYTLLLLACGAICLQFYRARVPGLVGTAVLMLMFPLAILETQFTVTSGYLAVAGLALAITGESNSKRWPWIGAAVLLVLSALVRFYEFAYVVLVASPFVAMLLWRQSDRALRFRWAGMLAATGIAIAGFTAINQAYYSGPEWQDFKQRTALAQPFVDYGLSRYYLEKEDKLAGSGLSKNDMLMLGQRAFMDEKIFNSASLTPLIEGVSVQERVAFNLHRWQEALKPFRSPEFAVLFVLCALPLVAGRRKGALFMALLLLLATMSFFWLWGRPGVVRIYTPPVAALAVLGLLTVECRRHILVTIAGCVLLAAALYVGQQTYQTHLHESAIAERQISNICSLPSDQLLVVWGAAGVYDRDIYRPAAPNGAECDLQLYVIGGLELLPESIDKLHIYTGGKSLVEALLAGQPMYLINGPGTDTRVKLLTQYLSEHYGVVLSSQKTARTYLLHVATP